MKELKLITDIGSTSGRYYIIDQNQLIAQFIGNGYNPTYQGEQVDILPQEVKKYLNDIGEVFYYGAGTSTTNASYLIGKALSISDQTLIVQSDMMAACYATCQGAKGLVAILGTGSNTAYFDGKKRQDLLPSMGYILGDQGSGNYIGKRVLQSYFFNKMPLRIQQLFENSYEVDRTTILDELYSNSSPAQYLGQFTQFLNKVEDDWKEELLQEIFSEFVDLHFSWSPHIKTLPLHFVGSVGFNFQNVIKSVCNNKGIATGVFLKEPGMDLVNYHLKKQ